MVRDKADANYIFYSDSASPGSEPFKAFVQLFNIGQYLLPASTGGGRGQVIWRRLFPVIR
jgi:hypothetical protein